MAFILPDGDENGILAVFVFHGQKIHSSIKVVKMVERTRILAYFSLSQTVGKLINFSNDSVSDFLKNLF